MASAVAGKRYEYLFLAKSAEEAKLYEDMANFVDKLVVVSRGSDLTEEERNLVWVAYKNLIDKRRIAWQTLWLEEQNNERRLNENHLAFTKGYRLKIESELSQVCSRVFKLVDDHLIPNAATSESKVFFLKMKGDCNRYLVEIKIENEPKKAIDDTLSAYKAAQEIALAKLAPTHPLRLGLALNFSKFYHDDLHAWNEAYTTAQEAFDDALAKFDVMNISEDSFSITRLLRDNITLWTSKM